MADTTKNLTVLMLNIGNDRRGRATDYGLHHRLANITMLIQGTDGRGIPLPDIVLMSEFRGCRHPLNPTRMLSSQELLAYFMNNTGYVGEYFPDNLLPECMGCAIFYNPERVMRYSATALWPLPGDGRPYGYRPAGAQGCKGFSNFEFMLLDWCEVDPRDGSLLAGEPINIVFGHAPMNQGRNDYLQAITYYAGDGHGSPLVCGDFNLIKELGGDDSRRLLQKQLFDHSEHLGETFVSFPYDTDKDGNLYRGALDFVGTSDSFPHEVTNVEVVSDPDQLISDHLPIVITIEHNTTAPNTLSQLDIE